MKDQAKFYVFAGVFGVGVIALLVGAYYWDFAPKAAKPAGDSFVAVQGSGSTPALPMAHRTAPPATVAVPGESAAAAASTAQTPSAQSTPGTLKKVDRQLRVIRQDLRTLTTAQGRMDQRLLHLQTEQQARSPAALPGMARGTGPAKALPGWSVESIGAGQAWIQGPSGNTHVVQAGATLDGFKVLAVDPDQVVTTRGRIGY